MTDELGDRWIVWKENMRRSAQLGRTQNLDSLTVASLSSFAPDTAGPRLVLAALGSFLLLQAPYSDAAFRGASSHDRRVWREGSGCDSALC